jgi:hypothetical protein
MYVSRHGSYFPLLREGVLWFLGLVVAGRVGVSADNAATESFFALLQKNVLDQQRWTTRKELR